jgi:hypothetical protein
MIETVSRHSLLIFFLCLVAAEGVFPRAAACPEEYPSRTILVTQAASRTAAADSSTVTVTPAVPVESGKAAPAAAIRPSAVMYHSLWLPGWGQLDNGRKKKAALFIAAEAFCIGGFMYEQYLLRESGGTEFERNRIRTDRNTFVIYWLGAKLFGMVDAYVDAQLRYYNVDDITPTDLKKDEQQYIPRLSRPVPPF